MISFKMEIAKRIRIQRMKAIGTIVFVLLAFILKVYVQKGVKNLSFVDWSILLGFFFGGFISSIRIITQYRKVLHDPSALEDLHIRETDERNRMIAWKTCQSTLKITCILLGFAGMIVSFFSLTLLYTIAIILVGMLVLYRFLTVYYIKKF